MNRHQFLQDELLEYFAQYADVSVLAQKHRWAIDARCTASFVGAPGEPGARSLNGYGFYGALNGERASIFEEGDAEREYDAEVVKGRCDYFVLPENPDTYALECAGALPRMADILQQFGRNAVSDLVIVGAATTWVFALFRERGGSRFGRV